MSLPGAAGFQEHVAAVADAAQAAESDRAADPALAVMHSLGARGAVLASRLGESSSELDDAAEKVAHYGMAANFARLTTLAANAAKCADGPKQIDGWKELLGKTSVHMFELKADGCPLKEPEKQRWIDLFGSVDAHVTESFKTKTADAVKHLGRDRRAAKRKRSTRGAQRGRPLPSLGSAGWKAKLRELRLPCQLLRPRLCLPCQSCVCLPALRPRN